MITFDKFKELVDKLDGSHHPEIGIYFKDNIDDYMIIKHPNYFTIGKFQCIKDGVYKFNDIDELYDTKIENICLKNDWNKIADILIDLTFSVIDNKNELKKMYNVDL